MDFNTHIYSLIIKERHLDFNLHVNNARYCEILEEARFDFIHHNGYGLDVIKTEQIGPVVLDIYIAFKKEIGLYENILIESRVSSYPDKVGEMTQIIFNQSRQIVFAEARLKFGLFDMRERKPIRPTPLWLKAVGLKHDATHAV